MEITLIYGTGNPAKLDTMRRSLNGMGIKLISLADMPEKPPEVDESGKSPLENARIKALSYYRYYGIPVFSCDSGLYFEGIADELQPGTHVRNIGGKRLSDDEMTEYYSALAKNNGGRITAQYLNAICLVLSENEIYEHMGADISGESFIITDKPHPKKIDGYPIDRISINSRTGKYYYDMSRDEYLFEESFDDGFRDFFAKALKIKEY